MKSSALKNFAFEAADIYLFSVRFFKELFRPRYEIAEFLKQCFFIGNSSLPLVAITALIMGLVITIQSNPAMEAFGT